MADLVKQAYRYELAPNREQENMLRRHVGAARFAYNWALEKKNEAYAAWKADPVAHPRGKHVTAIDLMKLWTLEKPGWADEVSRRVIEGAVRHLESAFKAFFRRLKANEEDPGFPKFKKHGNHESCSFFGPTIRVEDDCAILPTLGKIGLKEAPRVKGRITSATVSREAEHWFVSFQVERDRASPGPRGGDRIGVALGITVFATVSDGREITAPRPLQRGLDRLRLLSRRESRKVKGSKNRDKARKKLAKLHYRIACQRRDFHHKLTQDLCKNHKEVVIQTFNVKGMLQDKYLACSISDMGWYEWHRQMAYKGIWYGANVIEADKDFPSARKCSRCGNVKAEFPLSQRIYRCEVCGLVLKRGKNAAANLLQYDENWKENLICGASR